MGTVLVVAEAQPRHAGNMPALAPISYELLGAARRLGGDDVVAVLSGTEVRPLAGELAAHGAAQVYVADDPALADYVAETYLPVVEQAICHAQPSLVLLGQTANGRELAARLAFRLGCGLVTDCTRLAVNAGTLVMTKPVHGGSAIAEYVAEAPAALQMATLRPRAFEPAGRVGAKPAAIVGLEVPAAVVAQAAERTRVIETVRQVSSGPRLKDARIVVAGGRGVGSAADWHLVAELAAALGGAVGATRAVTDAGWAPPSLQVGLTGATVTPDLYVAVGISGAVQHIAGCAGARTIVAINRDPNANIFKHARFGVVADYRQVLPALARRIAELRGD
ncbi:MAG: electron transfer flavoprotein subunit alpha/FixB family protein [Chloroflexi bacterium]|nr:electron transfer flavoprotein subunit alpha/FixB family protein [Chloroflexota bacterium]